MFHDALASQIKDANNKREILVPMERAIYYQCRHIKHVRMTCSIGGFGRRATADNAR
jgi:hypothetical protein